jgi:predicted secreted protein
MTDYAGRGGTIATSTDDVTYTGIAGVKDLSLSLDGKVIDVTDHDSGLFEEFIAGRNNFKVSFGGNLDPADAGYDALWTAATGRTTVYLRYRPAVGGGLAQYKMQAIVTKLEKSSPNSEANSFSCEAQVTGTVTKSAQ